MSIAYDLHIHTAASPCADDLMTPNNIVNMSLLKGLEVIAITDHQTVCNCEAVMAVGKKKGLVVIPGMEIECQEEFHMISLFKNIQSAKEMEAWLQSYMPPILNRPKVFGYQRMLNEEDEQVGEISQFLLVAANVCAKKIVKKARALEAVIYPAHIDRSSYSILSNLGAIPKELDFRLLEISQSPSRSQYEKLYPKQTIIQASDAHYLENIAESTQKISEEELTKNGII